MLSGNGKLNLSGGGDKKSEVLMGLVLGAIIVAALGFTIYFAVGGGSSSAPQDVHFQCMKAGCGHEFKLTNEELQQRLADSGEASPEGELKLDCPSCGAKKSCLVMTQCPECKKYYISIYQKNPRLAENPSPDIKDTCPHCGTDRIQWYREHRKKK